MRLIDADALLSIYNKWLPQLTAPEDAGDRNGVETCIAVLNDAPTVNAVVMPCAIGDKVYRIDKHGRWPDCKPFIQELTVTEISWKNEKYGDKDLGFAIIANGIRYKFTSIGKSVFLKREDAEAKLKEMSANA